MSKTVTAQVTTTNKYPKGHELAGQVRFSHQGLSGDNAGKEDEISVEVEVTVPESFEEAASADFYASEANAVTALQEDWKRRCVNAARPILRDAETELEWQAVAQRAVDSYEPGRKGGFQPRIDNEELDQFEVSDELRAFLAKRGVVKIG